jgi:hypothetical protein
MIIKIGILNPILNKRNERLIKKEKIKVGKIDIYQEKEIVKKQKETKEQIKKNRSIEQSPKIKRAYRGYIEIDDELIEEFGIQGNGTKKDPYIINSVENFPREIEIYKSKYYIKIVNCDLTSNFLGLYFSQNIVVENCKLDICEVGSSSDIKIINSSVTNILKIIRSKDVMIENSIITRLGLRNSFHNLIIKCEIEEFLIDKSRGNTFQQCRIPPNLLTEDRLNPPFKKYSGTGIFINIIIVFLLPFIFIAGFMIEGFLFGLITFLISGGILIVVIFPFIWMSKKSRSYEQGKFNPKDIASYPPNKVL